MATRLAPADVALLVQLAGSCLPPEDLERLGATLVPVELPALRFTLPVGFVILMAEVALTPEEKP